MGDLRALWAARSVAVVGASTRRGTPGRLAVEFLQRYGYTGRIVPVHPTATEIAGLPAYPSVRAAGGVELALILVPAAAVAEAVDDCGRAGVRVAIVGTAGFAETGAEGRAAQDDLVRSAAVAGMRLVGPNCIGSAGFATGLVASFSPLFAALTPQSVGPDSGPGLTPGGIGFASASGALGFGTVSLALERGMGLRAAVSTGNEADVTALEALAELAPECVALMGYLESLHDGPALRALAATGKPTTLLVAGRSAAGARAAASHTGALATPDRVVDGALRQLGITRVSDVDELLDVGDAFALCSGRTPAGPRVAVVTTSGGSGILATDAIVLNGLTLAELAPSTVDALKEILPPYGSADNPVDVTATVMRDRTLMARALAAVADDDGVDVLVVCFCVLVGSDVDAIVAALSTVEKPVLVARTGADHLAPTAAGALRAAGIPSYPTPARAVRAAAALIGAASRAPSLPARRAESRGIPPGPTPRPPESRAEDADEDAVKRWLAAAGVRVPRGRAVHSAAEAEQAVREYGEPAVLKVVVPGLAHKTEAGGVLLGVTADTATAHYHRLAGLPGATGVLVEEQLSGGVELLVGVAPSPLGPALTIGAGGVHTEALDDVAVRLLPVTEHDVRDALGQTRVARLLAPLRGRAGADVDAFVALVRRVAALAANLPPGTTLDLNPVLVSASGAVVLDAALTQEG
ncbi:MAG TPA: acetate--CoA ligase family protein [Micromonosporaceae bacterium]|nr:acetate--CoA ligase family protein [Micromonosporaceae bacterium]